MAPTQYISWSRCCCCAFSPCMLFMLYYLWNVFTWNNICTCQTDNKKAVLQSCIHFVSQSLHPFTTLCTSVSAPVCASGCIAACKFIFAFIFLVLHYQIEEGMFVVNNMYIWFRKLYDEERAASTCHEKLWGSVGWVTTKCNQHVCLFLSTILNLPGLVPIIS